MLQQNTFTRKARVVSVEDSADGERIKVRLLPEDKSTSPDDLVYAYPFLPKFLHIKPKVGECVETFTAVSNDGYSQRFYVGPVISQPNHMLYEPYYLFSTAINRGSLITPEVAPSMDPETNGAFPKDEDIALEGRKNAGVQLTEDDVRIKAGVKVVDRGDNNKVRFNTKNPAYIKAKYHTSTQTTEDGQIYDSSVNVVADKINLIGTDSKECFNVTDPDDLITDEEMRKIIEKAHQLPYGDVLIEFLRLFRTAFLNHVHPYPGIKPCVDSAFVGPVQSYDLNKILSDTVRIT